MDVRDEHRIRRRILPGILIALAALGCLSLPAIAMEAQLLLQEKLEQAVSNGNVAKAAYVILEGADPEWVPPFIVRERCSQMQGLELWSPYIFIAAGNGYAPLVELLLEYDADIDAQFTLCHSQGLIKEATSLMSALSIGSEKIVSLLLENGADTEITAESSGQTAILALTYARRLPGDPLLEIDNRNLQRLIEANADIDKEDELGRTALWYAASSGKTSLVATLLSAGADTTAQGDCSEELSRDLYEEVCTAERIAELRGHGGVLEIFNGPAVVK